MNARQARQLAEINNPLTQQLQPIFDIIKASASKGSIRVEIPEKEITGDCIKTLEALGYKTEWVAYDPEGNRRALSVSW